MTTRLPATATVPATSLRSLVVDTVTAHPERPALTYRRIPSSGLGPRHRMLWQTLTWHEVATLVLEATSRLEAALGPRRRVAVLAETDARYPLLELAAGLSARTVQPLYVTSPDDELRQAMATADAEVLVAGRSQVQRARAMADIPVLELDRLVPLPGVRDAAFAALPADVEPFDTTLVRRRLAALPERAAGEPLLFLQSTGTSGPARVMEFSEEAVLASVLTVRGEATHPFPRLLSYLPTGHISERLLTTYVSLALAGHSWHGGGLTTLEADLRSCRPTLLLAPPLLLDAIRDQAVTAADASALGRRLLACVDATTERVSAEGRSGAVRRPVAARLFGRRLRRAAGLNRVLDAFVGTAPASADLLAWWEAAGIRFRDVYGQTEVAGATSMTPRTGGALAAVGAPLPGVEVRIGDGGELLVRSRSAFTRYVGDGVATSRVLSDGWLHTGDRAALVEGEIVLLGRTSVRTTAPDHALVDTDDIAAAIRALFSPADVAIAAAPKEPGAFLYIGVHAAGVGAADLRDRDAMAPVSGRDPRWQQVAALLERVDPHRAVRGVALLDGAFPFATGEVGPTGKLRAWRVHQVRSSLARSRAELRALTAGSAQPDRVPPAGTPA